MKSPTSSILYSIQALKNKLRNDHIELQGLRRDFAMGPTRPIIQTQQREQSPILTQLKKNSSLQKTARNKLIELRKQHQKQIKQVMQKNKMDKQELIKQYQARIQQMTKLFQQKMEEQNAYVTLLEEQIANQKIQFDEDNLLKQRNISLCSNVCQFVYHEDNTHRITFNIFHQSSVNHSKIQHPFLDESKNKYQGIVNKLLQENAELLQTVETLKMENRRLVHNASISESKNMNEEKQNLYSDQPSENNIDISREKNYYSVIPISMQDHPRSSFGNYQNHYNKNRLKFSKASQKSKHQTQRSYGSVNNQNINTSNFIYRNTTSIQKNDEQNDILDSSILEEDQSAILCEQIKLKTIKHFMKAVSHRSTQCSEYVEPIQKASSKRGGGIKNALKKLSLV